MPRLLGIVAALGLAASCGPQDPTASADHQSPTASPGPTGSATPPSPDGGCASQSHPANFAFSGSPDSSITVCPGRAAAGAVVHITLQGCNTPSRAPAALVFLGPSSWIGSGGAGNPVPFKMAGGDRFTATFTIPATYVGGETGASPNPTLPVRPGDHYAFATYPAGICDVPFTVTGGIRNLVITSAVRSELTAAYAAYRRISPSDITGTEPGSVHYAYDLATGTPQLDAMQYPAALRLHDQDVNGLRRGGRLTEAVARRSSAQQARSFGWPEISLYRTNLAAVCGHY